MLLVMFTGGLCAYDFKVGVVCYNVISGMEPFMVVQDVQVVLDVVIVVEVDVLAVTEKQLTVYVVVVLDVRLLVKDLVWKDVMDPVMLVLDVLDVEVHVQVIVLDADHVQDLVMAVMAVVQDVAVVQEAVLVRVFLVLEHVQENLLNYN